MAIEKTIVINADTKKAVKGVNEATKSIENNKKAIDNQSKSVEASKKSQEALNTATGGFIGRAKGMYQGLMTTVRGFGLLKTAIIASGIGALALVVLSVVQAFKRSEEGQDRYAKLMSFIGQAVNVVMDAVSSLGEMLIDLFSNPMESLKKFGNMIKDNIMNRLNGILELIPALGKAISLLFKGEFSEAGKVAGNAVAKVTLGVDDLTGKINEAGNATKEFIKEQQRLMKIAGEIADDRAKADKMDRELIVARAKANRDIADLREKAIDKEKFSTKERLGFLEEAQKIEDAILQKELESAKIKANAIIEENKLSKSNKEALKAEEEAKALVIELETRSLQTRKALTKAMQSLRAEDNADFKARADEQKSIRDAQSEDERKRIEESIKLETEKRNRIAQIEDEFFIRQLEGVDKLEAIRQKQFDDEFSKAEGNNELQKQLEIEFLNDLTTIRTQAEKEKNEKILALQTELENQLLEAQAVTDEEKSLLEINKLEKERAKREQELIDLGIHEEERARLLESFNMKIAEKEEEIYRRKEETKRQMALDSLSIISDLVTAFAGENEQAQKRAFKLNKAIAMSQALMSTGQAVVGALAEPSVIPYERFAKAVMAGGVGTAQMVKIAKTQFNSGSAGAGGGGVNIPSPSDTRSQPANFNVVGNSGVNQLADSLNSQPIKAYVVSGEVTSAQSLERNKMEQLTF